jgi:N-methylhydantoinase B
MIEIKTGDVLVKVSGGGGGVGNPFDRPAELVALDVKNEMISVAAARQIYGVAVDPATFAVDAAETRRLRAQSPSQWDVTIDETTMSVGLAPRGAG